MANGNNVFWLRQVVFEFQCCTKQHKQKITMKTNDEVTSFDGNQKWYLAMELKPVFNLKQNELFYWIFHSHGRLALELSKLVSRKLHKLQAASFLTLLVSWIAGLDNILKSVNYLYQSLNNFSIVYSFYL